VVEEDDSPSYSDSYSSLLLAAEEEETSSELSVVEAAAVVPLVGIVGLEKRRKGLALVVITGLGVVVGRLDCWTLILFGTRNLFGPENLLLVVLGASVVDVDED
jgi:hypothetical protein